MSATHDYSINLNWTGNQGAGTVNYQSYERSFVISAQGKPDLQGSSDPTFRGEKSKYNPEELLVASLSACHMLWYLHLCAVQGIVVLDYQDQAFGCMKPDEKGVIRFREVILNIQVTVSETGMVTKAKGLHHDAHKNCFIANSVNFPIKHQVEVFVK